jgi:hypothetical protein
MHFRRALERFRNADADVFRADVALKFRLAH